MMEVFITITMILTAVYLLTIVLITKTENIFSSIVFKVIPFMLGLLLTIGIVYACGFIVKREAPQEIQR